MLSTIPKIVCDQYIPFLVEAVQTAWSQVQICPMKPEQIDASAVREADVLVIRTRTQVNEALLSGSRVRLVCTATIGFDHIDTAYCDAHGIQWMSCPGCNAQAVCDYIEQAIEESKSSNLQILKSSNIQIHRPSVWSESVMSVRWSPRWQSEKASRYCSMTHLST